MSLAFVNVLVFVQKFVLRTGDISRESLRDLSLPSVVFYFAGGVVTFTTAKTSHGGPVKIEKTVAIPRVMCQKVFERKKLGTLTRKAFGTRQRIPLE